MTVLLFFVLLFSIHSVAIASPAKRDKSKAKYIFLFIGDGMSIPQVRIAQAAKSQPAFFATYLSQIANTADTAYTNTDLFLSKFKSVGMSSTNADNRYITCSAAAATALATGHKTTINTISMNPDRTQNMETIAEAAKAHGLKVGVVTSVSIDHATPACFYAHTPDRDNYEEIGDWLLKSDFDYFAGGSIKRDSYEKRTYTQYKDAARQAGYTYADTRAGFDALNSRSGKAIATLSTNGVLTSSGCAIPYSIDVDEMTSPDDRITLSEFTRKGIELLDNPKGFFMMVEGGKVDWAGHCNDLVSNTYEVISLDNAIGVAYEFYLKHPDETLIVITGDHETGGLTIGFAGTGYETSFEKLSQQKVSSPRFTLIVKDWAKEGKITFEQAMEVVKEDFGLGSENMKLSPYELKRLQEAFDKSVYDKSSMSREERYLYYGGYDPFTVTITHLLNNKAGIDWSTFSHTALPTPVYAIGVGSDQLDGFIDNTDIPRILSTLGGYPLK